MSGGIVFTVYEKIIDLIGGRDSTKQWKTTEICSSTSQYIESDPSYT